MNRDDSIQIEVVRVFCILTMMWVHVSPGLSIPSIVNGGSFDWLGRVLGHSLGRVSVTTLSFISGYLLWQSRRSRGPLAIVGRRALCVMLPMLVWSAIFMLLAVGKEQIIGHRSSALEGVTTGWVSLVNAWTGLTGPTANESLFFLRDLFVATVLLVLAAPLLDRWPPLVAAMALAIALGHWAEPLIFRPSILFFMALGAWAERGGQSFERLSRPLWALGAGVVLLLSAVLLMHLSLEPGSPILSAIDLLRRASIGAFVLVMTRTGMRLIDLRPVARWGRHSFLAYLSHASLIGILWIGWTVWIGTERDQSYLVFYLGVPALCFAAAISIGRLLDDRPAAVQLLLRGRVHGAGDDRAA